MVPDVEGLSDGDLVPTLSVGWPAGASAQGGDVREPG